MGARVSELSGAFCPVPSVRVRLIRLRSGAYKVTEFGLEMRCSKCRDYWPADTEFFYSVPSLPSGLNQWCKACYEEWRRARKRKTA